MLSHTHPYKPWGRLKWPHAITRLTSHFTCDLLSDLVMCKQKKSMVIHDTKCPHWNQVSLNNSNTNLHEAQTINLPSLSPPGTMALLSPGHVFLFTVIEHNSHTLSTRAPSIPFGRRSSSTKWLSVPPNIKHTTCNRQSNEKNNSTHTLSPHGHCRCHPFHRQIGQATWAIWEAVKN